MSFFIFFAFNLLTDNKIHNMCSFTENLDTWGTLETFSNVNTSKDKNCWCTMSSQLNQRIILSVITFDYTPTDMKCPDIGFYLRADSKQEKECTVLRKDRYYISSSNNLYLTFQPKYSNAYRKFWIIYEGKV